MNRRMKRRGGRRCGSAVILAVCLHCTVPAFGQDSPKLSTDIESRGGTVNVVARKAGWLGRMTVVSGGIMLGVTDYKFDRWKTTQRVEHDGNTITLLTPDTLSDELLNAAIREASFAKQYAAALDARSKLFDHGAKLDVSVRLVPRDARFRHEEQLTITDMEQLPLHLVGTLPQSADEVPVALRQLMSSVIHESFHLALVDQKRFNQPLTLPDEETRAYALQHCAGMIARNEVPDSLRDYPAGLTNTVAEPELITLAEVYRGLIEQRNAPTIVGNSTAQLALHLFYKAFDKTAGRKPTAAQFVEFCRGMVAGRYLWAVDGVDGKIADAARQQAQLSGLVAAPEHATPITPR